MRENRTSGSVRGALGNWRSYRESPLGKIMTYGYRLNVEDIFLKHADDCWHQAELNMSEIQDEIPETGEQVVFVGPINEECISQCVQAIVGWAICIESFVNLSWNSYISTKNDTENLRRLSTYDKIKHIFKEANIDMGDKYWLADVKKLFSQRNKFVHFKETITYYGFSFAPEYQKDLSRKNLTTYRFALEQTIELLGTISGVDTKLLNAEYELFYYDE